MMKTFRLAAVAAAAIALTGCAINLTPESSMPYTYKTAIPDAEVQVVLSKQFQTDVKHQKPSFGESWKHRTMTVHTGKPLTESIVKQVRAVAPRARVGDRDDGQPAVVTVIPQTVDLEFGVDDKKFMRNTSLVTVFALGTKLSVASTARLASTVVTSDGSQKAVTVTGSAEEVMSAGVLRIDHVEKVIGASLDDAAEKLVAEIEGML